jgi:hypothetical protein
MRNKEDSSIGYGCHRKGYECVLRRRPGQQSLG